MSSKQQFTNTFSHGKGNGMATQHAAAANLALSETCIYCDRVRWGEFVYLTNGQWRHEECAPGSQDWREWYHQHPEKRSAVGDILAAT